MNVAAVNLNWRSAEALITQANAEYKIRLDRIEDNYTTTKEEILDNLKNGEKKISKLEQRADSIDADFTDETKKIDESVQKFYSYVDEQQRNIELKLGSSSKKLDLAQRHYEEIVKLVQSLNLYSAIDRLADNKQKVVDELTNQIGNDPALFEAVAEKINSSQIQYYVGKNTCGENGSIVQAINLKNEEDKVSHVLCVSKADLGSSE